MNGNDKKKCETNDKQMVLYNGTKKSIARHLISQLATIIKEEHTHAAVGTNSCTPKGHTFTTNAYFKYFASNFRRIQTQRYVCIPALSLSWNSMDVPCMTNMEIHFRVYK